MRVAFVLIVALLCVALVAAGSGKGKDKKAKDNRENKKTQSWEGKKNHKEGRNKNSNKNEERGRKDEKKWQGNKENEVKDGKNKRTKREETEQPIREQETKHGKDSKQYQKIKVDKSKKNQKRTVEEDPIIQEQPTKKKSKKTESIPKKEEVKKSKDKKTEKVQKVETVEESADEETTIVIEESETEVTIEDVEGECSQEPTEECQEEPEVTLSSSSKLKGKKGKTQAGRDTAEFTGVPYAEPPVGKDRLKEAVLKDTWPGVLRATSAGSDCLQYSHFTYSILGSEDCLYLNVYSPKLPKENETDNELMPVVVYIHGGAFMFFSSARGGPRYLLDHDIVLVTLNYRLGPLGFLSFGDESVPGNLGLRDQLTALKWIQKHIKSFGGDPQRVTLSGMSAGAASVHYHLLSPLSKGLFSKAISISGTALNPWAEVESVVEKSLEVIHKLDCDAPTTDEMVACLRTRSAEKIVATSKELQKWLYNPISPWAPSPEPRAAVNPFLPDYPINLMNEGKSRDVPWLVSWADKEGGYPGGEFVPDASLLEHLENNWLEIAPHLLEFNFSALPEKHNEISMKVKEFYLKGKPATDQQSATALINMLSDRLFLEGIAEMIRGYVNRYQSPIFTYRFSYEGQDSVAKVFCNCNYSLGGACHADDLGYFIEALAPKLSTPEELQLSKDMVDIWHSFITTGVPTFRGQALPKVERSQQSIPFLDIGQGGKAQVLSDHDLGNQEFWKSLGLSDLAGRTQYQLKDEL